MNKQRNLCTQFSSAVRLLNYRNCKLYEFLQFSLLSGTKRVPFQFYFTLSTIINGSVHSFACALGALVEFANLLILFSIIQATKRETRLEPLWGLSLATYTNSREHYLLLPFLTSSYRQRRGTLLVTQLCFRLTSRGAPKDK